MSCRSGGRKRNRKFILTMNDVLLKNNDLSIADGDFEVGQSDQQNIELIVESMPGEFKQFPMLGFGAVKYLKGDFDANDFKRDLKIQFEYDNYNNVNIDFSEDFKTLKIDIK